LKKKKKKKPVRVARAGARAGARLVVARLG
jgi:hypothetical protein